MEKIRLAGVVRESIVDGPGLRFVVFTQGCPHACPGCHNPQSHCFTDGYDCAAEKIVAAVEQNPLLSGVTFSGGEPFCQPQPLYELAVVLKQRGLNLITYSGYTYEQLTELAKATPAIGALLGITDYLIDGRYVQEQRDLTLSFRGSRNQRIVDVAATRAAGSVVTTEL